MAFEKFTNYATVPYIMISRKIHIKGQKEGWCVFFSRGVVEKFGINNDYVNILYDEEKKLIGFSFVKKRSHYSFVLSKTKGKTGRHLSCNKFFHAVGLEFPKENIHFLPYRKKRFLVIDLNKRVKRIRRSGIRIISMDGTTRSM